jgi:hypothetical protein
MHLPKSWSNISVSQYAELKGLDASSFDSVFDYNLEMLSIITDTDINEIEDLDFDEMTAILTQLNWINREPNKPINRNISDLHYIGLQHLKVGEFIDLEYYFTNNYYTHLTEICGVLYRKSKLDEWNNVVYEPYTYDLNERKQLFNEIPCTDVYGILKDYILFRDNFMESYINLFQEPATDEIEDDLTDEEAEEVKKEDNLNKWSWEKTLYILANEDITRIDDVLKMNLIFAFNMLSMKTDLQL